MSDPQPRWQRRKDARPAEIIDAALALFIDKGYAATRLDDVAKLAGVTKGTVYLYFTNKEDLFKAVVRDTLLPELDMAENLISDNQGSWEELLRELVMRWSRRLTENRSAGAIAKLMIAEAANFPDLAEFYIQEVVVRSRRIFADVITRGIEAKEFRPVDVSKAVRAATTPLLMVKIWRCFAEYDPEPLSVDEYAAFHFDMLMHGLKSQEKP